MTEIEMDIDMAKPVLDGKIEDDFIDFDTDMVDSNHDLQKNDDNLESMDREMQEDEDAVNHEAYETNGITGEDVDFDLHDVEDTANSPEHVDYEVTEAPELGTQGPIQTAQPPDEDVPENEENVEILDEIIVHGDAVSDDHESTHEIDYEFEDNAESEDSHQDEKTAAASRATRSEPNGTAGAAEEQDDHEPENDATATGQELSDHTGDENNISSHNDQNEPRDPKEEEAEPDEVATGEAEAEDVKADEYNVENTHASDDNDEIHDGEDANSHEETTTLAAGQNDETTEAVEEAEDHDYDVGEHVADAYDEHATTDTDHVDHSATGEDSNGKTDEGFPAITVQYKGDEFPMFSTTTHGFFANTSVLDEPLEKLIAGLRSELENEIAEDDDLVLQVDELGLELVETTQGETMSNVTLRQILEIFDLLVKNQDPDGSRPLYAYLFTKPNAEKRFEYLVESATAGKGLDEVIHLFETPMTAGTSMLETAATIDGVHEELDEFDSPIDDEHHSEIDEAENEDEYLEGEHANPDATGSEGQEFKDQEVDDHEVNSQQANNQDGHYEDDQDNINVATDTQIEISVNASAVNLEDPETAVDSLTAADEDGLEQNGKATSLFSTFLCCYYPDFCLCAPCVSAYVENHNKDEAEFRKTVKCNYGTMQILSPKVQYLRPHQSKHHRSLSDFSTTYSFNNTDEFIPARADSEIDPFANFELDEEAEFNGDVALGENTETQDEVNVDAEPEPLHAQTNDTSTTTTLQEEEEASSFNVDLGVASATVETAEKSKTDDDDLDEIDWRDEHEPEDQAPSTPSAAGKRARGDDDDVDAEDEQDAKRRRP